MFHFKNSRGKRNSASIAVGDMVQSRYRAPWKGRVLGLDPVGGIAEVLQVIDRHNNPIRKPKVVYYHVTWFRSLLPEAPSAEVNEQPPNGD